VRHRTNKLLLVALITLVLALAMIGCADATSHLIVNRDGSADLTITARWHSSPAAAATAQGIVAAAEPLLAQRGLALHYAESESEIVLSIDKHVDDLDELLLLMPTAAALKQPDSGGIKVQHGLLRDRYQARLNLTLHDWLAEYLAPWQLYLVELVMDSSETSLQVTLPWLPKEHNADFVEGRGRTLGWWLQYDQPTQLYVLLQLPNRNCLRLSVVAGLLVLILWLSRKR
jgi:hypothetical protein